MIGLNDFKRTWNDIRADVLTSVEAVGASGWYILGKEGSEFESALAAVWRMPHCIGVASGLDAIEISLKALGCSAGDRVLTTPLSAFATTLAIVKLGAIPVFVDCGEDGLIDLPKCADALRKRPEIRYFVPVHLYGHCLNLEALRSLRDEFGLRIVEDCAQSILAASGDSMAGSVGQMAATSFYPTKNLGALGDAGAIATSDDLLAGRARRLRNYGQSEKYLHSEIGYNSRLDELQAAILSHAQLPRLRQWTDRRIAIAERYSRELRHPEITLIGPVVGSTSCWHLFPVLVSPARKLDFMAWLRSRGVESGEHYPTPIPDQPAMKNTPHEVIGDCAQARRIANEEVSLPIHPYLRDDEIASVIAACNRWPG